MKRIIKIFSEYLKTKDINKLILELKKVEKKNWLCIRFNDTPSLYTIQEIEQDLTDTYHNNYSFLISLIESGIKNKNIKTY